MSSAFIDLFVIIGLFTMGMAWTVARYAKRDRLAFIVMALASPLIAVFAVFSLIYQVCAGKVEVGPCPPGLAEAERQVELERQRMFGGELREPRLSLDWQRAYEMELQREAESVKRLASRVFVHA